MDDPIELINQCLHYLEFSTLSPALNFSWPSFTFTTSLMRSRKYFDPVALSTIRSLSIKGFDNEPNEKTFSVRNLMLPADATGGSSLSIFYCIQECLFLEHVIMTLLPSASAFAFVWSRPAPPAGRRPSVLPAPQGLFGKNRCIANLNDYTVPSILLTRYVRT